MNVGFKEALSRHPFTCFAFHDIDLLPEDTRNDYACPSSPRHMSVAIDKFGYEYVNFICIHIGNCRFAQSRDLGEWLGLRSTFFKTAL